MATHSAGVPLTVLVAGLEVPRVSPGGAGESGALLAAAQELVRREVEAHGGGVVSSTGDRLVAEFNSPRRAAACALAVQNGICGHDARLAAAGAVLRLGLHAGGVTEADGALQGTTVAAIAICARAPSGGILASEVVRDLCGATDAITFVDRGRLTLAGAGRWRLYGVSGGAGTVLAAAPATAGLTPYVGRDRERAELGRLLERAAAGRGGLAFIGGEPGVGKTRLTAEIAAEAERRGLRTFTGHSYQTEGDQPYMPWVEIVEAASRQMSPAAMRKALGDTAAELARIVTRLRQVLPEIPPPLELPPDQQRRHTFNSIRDYVGRVSQMRPQLYILEDLHLADESTLLFLEHLAERVDTMPVAVLGTYRDAKADLTPMLAGTLTTLIRRRRAQLIVLEPLSQPQVEAMLGALSGHDPPAAVTGVIFAQTGGNPLFVEELFTHLAGSGRLLDGGGFRPDLHLEALEDVPSSVLPVLDQRLGRLTAQTRELLGVAAVTGARWSFELLQEVSQVDEDALLDALEEAEHARLVTGLDTAGGGQLGFTHELLRQTLLGRIPSATRQRHHLDVATALERLHSADLEQHAADIAHHLVAAGSAADPTRTVRFLTHAGDRAAEAAAFEEALRTYQLALSLLPVQETRWHGDLLLKLGLVQRSLGRWEETIATWNRALTAMEVLGEVERVASLCWDFCVQLAWARRFEECLAVARRGLAAIGERPGAGRARLLALCALGLSGAGSFDEAAATLDEARRMARQAGDEALTGDIWLVDTFLYNFSVQVPQTIEAAGHAASRLRQSERLWNLADVLAILHTAHVIQGRLVESEAVRAELDPLTERLGHLGAATIARGAGVYREAALTADLTAIQRLSASQLKAAESMASTSFLSYAHTLQGAVDFWRGDWEGARSQMEAGARVAPQGVWFGAHHGFLIMLLAFSGERDEAFALLHRVGATLPARGRVNTLGAWHLAILAAEGVGVLGGVDQARMLHPLVVEAIAAGAVLRQIDGRLVRTMAGMVAAAGYLFAEAEEHFEIALRQADELPHALERPCVRHFYAHFLLRRAGAEDVDRARALLAEAVQAYRSIGMPRHEAMARELMRRA